MPQKSRPQDSLLTQMVQTALKLSLFVFIAVSLLTAVWLLTDEPIKQAEQRALIQTLQQVMPASHYDNDLLADTRTIVAPEALGTNEPVTVYRARKDNQPVGLVIQAETQQGYSPNMQILVGVNAQGKVLGVRVLQHAETPGLGDKVEPGKSDWIHSFRNKSLQSPPAERWTVQKYGGAFDQFTGATITPKAVVEKVRDVLQLIEKRGETLYE
ncbi:MAG: electron transport complex subunit RsxG [Hydrogenovibrio sp.]|uniref:electron transport complex subunit RsxG n=1 Tax=Hydrogenovibrio sp. TaxID=2065821 RepID=UPI00286FD8DF|nr:electron transport complex subunit RsxG [Hydrogenovibrio sp.]MDR9499523.1 electron transport complex subunit RsxG [Hydrogenovibrio sp.]